MIQWTVSGIVCVGLMIYDLTNKNGGIVGMIHSTMGYNGMYLVEFDPDVTIICRQLVYVGNQPIYFMLVNYHSLPRYE